MNAAYFTAAIPEPYQILGLKLKPLSVGRYRLLHRCNVAFVDAGEAQAGIPDLILGVLICSMRVDEFEAWAQSKRCGRDISRWRKKICNASWIGRVPWLGKRWRKKHLFNAFEKAALFKRFIAEHSVVPDYWHDGNEAAASGSHWVQSLEVTLRSELGWGAEEVNEAPLSKAIADYFKHAENRGALRIMTEEEREHGRNNARIMAALAEQNQGGN